MKKEKAKCKAAYTRNLHKLSDLLDGDIELPSRREIKDQREKLSIIQEKLFIIYSDLYGLYKDMDDVRAAKIADEMDSIEDSFSKIIEKAQEYLNCHSDVMWGTGSEASDWDTHSSMQELNEDPMDTNTVLKNPTGPLAHDPYPQPPNTEPKYKFCPPLYPNEKPLDLTVKMTENPTLKQNCEISSIGGTKGVRDVTLGHQGHQENRTENCSEVKELGNDMWKQLKRVQIPVFSGDKRRYEPWKAAFVACIDKAPATAEYKLLQLRQYLSGEALKCIENLGHSAVAYEKAKERLDRKFGGQRRQVAIYLDELESFKPLNENSGNMVKEIERFADLLDIAIVNLKEIGRVEELGNGSLYQKIQRKLPEQMLARYHRWVFENSKEESMETLRYWVIQEAEFQTIAAETIRGLTLKESSKYSEPKRRTQYTNFANDKSSTTTRESNQGRQKRQFVCKHCGGSHGIWKCNDFQKLNVSQRWDFAKQFRLCYRCLGDSHIGQQCPRSKVCGVSGCKEIHHNLLHKDKRNQSSVNTGNNADANQKNETSLKRPMEGDTRPNNIQTMTTSHKPDFCVLRTVPVIVKNGNRTIKVNARLDDASTKTYINADIAAELGLSGQVESVNVNVLNGNIKTFETMPVTFELQSVNGRITQQVSAFTAERVTGDMKVIQWSKHSAKYEHLKALDFPEPGQRTIVDLLIGIDYPDLHYSYHDIKGQPGEPVARLTPLGWTCVGNPNQNCENRSNFSTFFIRNEKDTDSLNTTLNKFWEVEEFPTSVVHHVKPEDKSCLDQMETSLQFENGHYEVAIPWKEKNTELPNNYSQAVNRLENTEKRLLKNPEIGESYSNTIKQYVEKDYIRKVEGAELCEAGWFLPHFPVIRPDKATTKTRIVFDASAKYEGISLNDKIHQGPKLQNELFNVLLRFRKYPIGLICDIAEMYLRIGLAKDDRPFHRFLWRELETSRPPDQYEFNRVVFGVNSSPFQAQYVVQQHAKALRDLYPLAAETILKSTYMDDSMDSVMTEEKGIELYNQLNQVWEKAGMHARKWLSNSEKVLQGVPVEDRASEVDLESGHLPATKTLGLIWVAKEDEFTFKVSQIPDNFVCTKRNFLKKIASLFDPLGFLAPYTIRAKILLQEMWTSGLDWDDKLDEHLINQSMKWFTELNELEEIRVPRCLSYTQKPHDTVVLHVFTDASKDAYGAVVYAKYAHENGSIDGSIVTAKSKVAPLLAVSIPRLELMGAILGCRLGLTVAETLDIDSTQIVFWSDSMNVLWWIRGRSRNFKPFVANRIGEIQSKTNPEQWRYVPTKKNPADYLTRGKSVTELAESDMWWKGPDFLEKPETEWPENKIATEEQPEMKAEMKRNASTMCTVVSATDNSKQDTTENSDPRNEAEDRLNPERFSDWTRLVRVKAWVNRFVRNCKLDSESRIKTELQPEEIETSELQIIRKAQKESFHDEYKNLVSGKEMPRNSKLLTLRPKLDDDKVMRCDGRLKHAEFLSYNVRHPILLPRKHCVTRLIVKHYHELGKHCSGTNQTLSALSARFWIIAGREEIRDWERECAKCRLLKAKPTSQIMAPLPENRIKVPLRAFSSVAVDYGGPFVTVQGRGKRREKRYLCLFTCLSCRAVHLEVAFGLDTDSFLNAFYRMVNRRGLPELVIFDNGTNFKGAVRELRELVEQLDQSKIQEST